MTEEIRDSIIDGQDLTFARAYNCHFSGQRTIITELAEGCSFSGQSSRINNPRNCSISGQGCVIYRPIDCSISGQRHRIERGRGCIVSGQSNQLIDCENCQTSNRFGDSAVSATPTGTSSVSITFDHPSQMSGLFSEGLFRGLSHLTGPSFVTKSGGSSHSSFTLPSPNQVLGLLRTSTATPNTTRTVPRAPPLEERMPKEWPDEEKADDTMSDDWLCQICEERRKCVVFEPCHHLIVCVTCVRQLMTNHPDDAECPMCRTPIQRAFRAFA